MYELEKFDFTNLKKTLFKPLSITILGGVILVITICITTIFVTGKISLSDIENWGTLTFNKPADPTTQKSAESYVSQISYEQAIIDVVKSASPSVVSIIISKDLPVYEEHFINPFGNLPDFGFGTPFNFEIPQYVQKGTRKQQVGSGSGFIVSEDGLVLTNKHVVIDSKAEYAVLTNDGKKYPAKVLAKVIFIYP